MIWIKGLFYFVAFIVMLLIATRRSYQYENEYGELKTYTQNSKFLIAILMLALIIVSGFRNKFIDTADYRYMYGIIGKNLENVFNGSVPRVEKGYLFFTYLLNLINTDSQFLLIVTSIITVFTTVKFITRESSDIAFSMWMFFCIDYINTMNGVRQVMAGAIAAILWSLLYGSEQTRKKDVLYIAGILLLATVHKSILICIPVILLSRKRFMSFATWGFIIGSVMMLAVPGLYYAVLEGVLGGSSYTEFFSTSAGMGIARFIVKTVPIMLIIVSSFRGFDFREEDARTQWMLNIVVFNSCCSLLALRMVYFARLSIYFNFFDFILMPYLIETAFGKDGKIVKGIAYILYAVYYFVQINAFGGYISGFDLVI